MENFSRSLYTHTPVFHSWHSWTSCKQIFHVTDFYVTELNTTTVIQSVTQEHSQLYLQVLKIKHPEILSTLNTTLEGFSHQQS